MDAPPNHSGDLSHEDHIQINDGMEGSRNAEIAPYDSPQDTVSSASLDRPAGEDADADNETSDSEHDGVQGSFPNQEEQDPTNRRYYPETLVFPAPAPDELGGTGSTRTINDAQVNGDDSDGPPGLSSVSGSTDIGEESGDDLNNDDQMPELQPIGFYSNPAGAINPSREHGTTSQNNMSPNEPAQNEATRSSIQRNDPFRLGAQDAGANRSMFPDRFSAFMEEVYRTLGDLRDSGTTASNRAQEIVEKMHVLNKEELRRFQSLIMLQADNEEDRVRGASCSVCWEILILSDEQKEISAEEGKGKEKDHDSRSSMESDGSGPSAHSQDKRRIIALPCTHVFHSTCLVPWFVRSATCPECRFDLDPSRRIAAASNPVPPRPGMSRDIYDLHNRPRRNEDQSGLPASTSAGRSRSLPRDGSNDLVAGIMPPESFQSGSNPEEQAPSNPTSQPAGIFPVENMVSSRETPEPPDRQETATVGATNHQEAANETLNGRADEDIGRGSNQRPLDLRSPAQQDGDLSPNPRPGPSIQVVDTTTRSPIGNSAGPHGHASSHVSERLSGIRDSLNGVQSRIRSVENRLEGVEGRLRGIDGRSGVRSNALDSARALNNRQDVGLFNVGSREEAIRRLRSLATEDSSTNRPLPASADLPAATMQTTVGGQLNERRRQMRDESSPRPPSEINQFPIPTPSSSTTTEEPIVDPSVIIRSPEVPTPTTTFSNAPARQSDRVRTSVPGGEGSPLDQGTSMPSIAPALETETGDEDTARLEQEIRELEEQLESDRLYVQIGDNALQRLSGMMNNLSRVLREAALQEQVFSQAIDALQVHSQGQPSGSPGLGTTSSDTQIDSRTSEQIGNMAAVPVSSDDVQRALDRKSVV